MSTVKRAERRHHLDRMKAKARGLAGLYNGPGVNAFAKLYDHLAHCSGRCCGNPRRWADCKREALTMQERRVFACEDFA